MPFSFKKLAVLFVSIVWCNFTHAQFTAGNITVLKIGNGSSASLTSISYAEYIAEYTPSGTLVQTIAIPNTTAGARSTESGSATSDGDLSLSGDGRYITFGGYDAAAGTTGVVSSSGTARMITQLDNSTNVTFPATLSSTATTGFYQSNNLRSVTTNDGTGYYTAGTGTNGGINYIPFGTTNATTASAGVAQLNTSATNMRTVRIFYNQLYGNSSSGSYKDPFTIGSGIPSTGSQTYTVLSGLSNTHDGYGFIMFDKNRDGIPDLMYVADNTIGLFKYYLNSSNVWTSVGSLTNGITGITGYLDCSNNPVLFVTTASSGPSNNKLYKYTDMNPPSTSLPSSSLASSATLLASAGTGYIFRGIAMAPTLGDLTVSANTTAAGNYRRIIINPGTTLTLTGNVTVSDSVYVASGATLDCGVYKLSGKSFFLDAGAGLKIGDPNGITVSSSLGNIQTNCRSYSSSASYEYEGNAAQVTGDGLPLSVYNLTITNTSSGVTLTDSILVTHQLKLNSGVFYSSSTNKVLMASASTTTGASNASYVDGPIKKYGSAVFVFPIGNNSYYAPITITSPSLATDNFTAQYFDTDPNPLYDVTLKDPSIDHLSRCEYWILNRTGGSANVYVILSWDSLRSCGVDALSELTVGRWDGTMWKDEGNSLTLGTTVSGKVKSLNPITSFSPFTLASTSTNNPLPISLLSFDAVSEGSIVNLNWTTISETNNDFFTLERSADAQNFNTLKTIKGAGNSNQHLYYSILDSFPFEGTSYYRLKQTDFNGASKYSEIKSVTYNKTSPINVFPNPADNNLFISGINLENHSTSSVIKITNVLGDILFSKNINSQLELNISELPSGIYFIEIDHSGEIFRAKFVKK